MRRIQKGLLMQATYVQQVQPVLALHVLVHCHAATARSSANSSNTNTSTDTSGSKCTGNYDGVHKMQAGSGQGGSFKLCKLPEESWVEFAAYHDRTSRCGIAAWCKPYRSDIVVRSSSQRSAHLARGNSNAV